MNKSMNKAMRQVRRDLHEQKMLHNKDSEPAVNVRKFSELYSALSNKRETYETRLIDANRIAQRIALAGITDAESKYVSELMAGTISHMDIERRKRKGVMLDRSLANETLNPVTEKTSSLYSIVKQASVRLATAATLVATMMLSTPLASYADQGIVDRVKSATGIGDKKPTSSVKPREWTIGRADINVYDEQGNIFKQYKKLRDGSEIEVPESGRIEVVSPKVATNSSNKQTITLDILLKNPNGHYHANKNPIIGRTARAFPLAFEVEDAGMTAWEGKDTVYTAYLTAETGRTTADIKESVTYKVKIKPKKAAAPTPPAQPNPNVSPVAPPATEKPVPPQSPPPQQRTHSPAEVEEQTTDSRLIVGAEGLLGHHNYQITVDPAADQVGFLGFVRYDNNRVHVSGGGKFTKEKKPDKTQPILSTVEGSINADYKVLGRRNFGVVIASEAGTSNTTLDVDGESPYSYMASTRDFPQASTTFLSGGAGFVIGPNQGSNIRATIEQARATQNGGFYTFPYGEVGLSSRTLNGQVIKVSGIVDTKHIAIEGFYTDLKLQDRVRTVDITSKSKGARVYVPIGKDGKLNLTAGFQIGKYAETGPAAFTGQLNRNHVSFGFAWKDKKRK